MVLIGLVLVAAGGVTFGTTTIAGVILILAAFGQDPEDAV